jgi:hypothetical protein
MPSNKPEKVREYFLNYKETLQEINKNKMQIVERILNEPKLGEIKLQCVCEILKPYFLYNVDLIKRFADLNFSKIKCCQKIWN